jgi:hypothetical protein
MSVDVYSTRWQVPALLEIAELFGDVALGALLGAAANAAIGRSALASATLSLSRENS